MDNKYIMLAWAMACVQMDDKRVLVHSDQGMTTPKDAFASFCVEFDPSDKEFKDKLEHAHRFIQSDGRPTIGAIVSVRTPDGECSMEVFTEPEYDKIVERNRFLIEREYRIVKEESRANLTAIYFRDEQDKIGLSVIANL